MLPTVTTAFKIDTQSNYTKLPGNIKTDDDWGRHQN